MSPGSLVQTPPFNAVFSTLRLLKGGGAPTGTQAQLVVFEPTPGASGKTGAGRPGAVIAKQLLAQ